MDKVIDITLNIPASKINIPWTVNHYLSKGYINITVYSYENEQRITMTKKVAEK